jgi:hypothetical protein
MRGNDEEQPRARGTPTLPVLLPPTPLIEHIHWSRLASQRPTPRRPARCWASRRWLRSSNSCVCWPSVYLLCGPVLMRLDFRNGCLSDTKFLANSSLTPGYRLAFHMTPTSPSCELVSPPHPHAHRHSPCLAIHLCRSTICRARLSAFPPRQCGDCSPVGASRARCP